MGPGPPLPSAVRLLQYASQAVLTSDDHGLHKGFQARNPPNTILGIPKQFYSSDFKRGLIGKRTPSAPSLVFVLLMLVLIL